MTKRRATRTVAMTDADRLAHVPEENWDECDWPACTVECETCRARDLLGLIERHGWNIGPGHLDDGSPRWVVQAFGCGHFAPTLIEALTAAANCNRCCGRQS